MGEGEDKHQDKHQGKDKHKESPCSLCRSITTKHLRLRLIKLIKKLEEERRRGGKR